MMETPNKATGKQIAYIKRLLNDADTDLILRKLYVQDMLGRKVPLDLSDVTKKEASVLIEDLLLAVVCEDEEW